MLLTMITMVEYFGNTATVVLTIFFVEKKKEMHNKTFITTLVFVTSSDLALPRAVQRHLELA